MFKLNMTQHQQPQKRESRKPDHTGQITETLGYAVWRNPDGDHDVKVGQLVLPAQAVIVRSTVPLSQFTEYLRGVVAVAGGFSGEETVRQDIRQTLRGLSNAYEAVEFPQLNGPTGGLIGAA